MSFSSVIFLPLKKTKQTKYQSCNRSIPVAFTSYIQLVLIYCWQMFLTSRPKLQTFLILIVLFPFKFCFRYTTAPIHKFCILSPTDYKTDPKWNLNMNIWNRKSGQEHGFFQNIQRMDKRNSFSQPYAKCWYCNWCLNIYALYFLK